MYNFAPLNATIMKKVILLFLFASSIVISTQAQLKIGAKAGLNLANIVGDDAPDEAKTKLGFNIGGFVEVPVAENFTVKPELVFSLQGAKSDDNDDSKLNLNYLNIPVLGKYTTSSGFYGETGPQLGFLVGAKAKSDDGDVDVKDFYKGIDFAWAFGVGYEFAESGFGVNLRYNLGLSNIVDDGDADVSQKNSVFQIGVTKTIPTGGAARRR